MFGEKRMSVQRERLAGTLSRSCRIPATRPSLACTAGRTMYRFREKGGPSISRTVASRNEEVDRNSKAIQHFSKLDGSPRMKNDRDRRISESAKVPQVDSKALTAEIDSVAMELRNLIAGVDTDMSLAQKSEVRKDEDEEEGQSLHAKLLKYRYVRKIEAPPPPLEPLDGTYLKAPREVDKMEMNLQKFRISWKRDALERARHWNKETADRISTARCRRDEEIERSEAHFLHQLAEKEKVPQRVGALRMAQVEKMKAKAAAREEKLELVRRKKQEELEARQLQLQELLGERKGQMHRQSSGRSESPAKNPEGEESIQEVEPQPEAKEEGIDWFQSSLREEDEEEEEERDKKEKETKEGQGA